MKKISSYITLLFLIFCVFAACKKMDSTYKNFIVPGGLTYTGKVSNPLVYAGHNRIKISWLRGSDPSVTKARVFWNNQADSIDVSIPATGDTISVIITGLLEKSYSFIVRTYNDKGNFSVPVELFGSSYGTLYQSGLLDRPVITSEMDLTDTLVIAWGSANTTAGAFATELQYTGVTGKTQDTLIKASESTSKISDYKKGTAYQYRTLYIPDSLSIDTFYTAFTTQQVHTQLPSVKIDKTNWTATADCFEPTSLLPKGGPPNLAFDDDVTTYWFTTRQPAFYVYPHWVAADMKQLYTVPSVELTCRKGPILTFTAFTIQGSMDGISWDNYDSFTLPLIDGPQRFLLTGSPQMRYIRLFCTVGTSTANIAEFSAYGYQ